MLSRDQLVSRGVDVFILDKLTEKLEWIRKSHERKLVVLEKKRKRDDPAKEYSYARSVKEIKVTRDVAETVLREHQKDLSKKLFGEDGEDRDKEDDYGDGNQSEVKGFRERGVLTLMTGESKNICICLSVTLKSSICIFSALGGDHNPFKNPLMSEWSKHCFLSDLDRIKAALKKDPTLLDKRESCCRFNGLLHVIFGAIGKSPLFEHVTGNERVPINEEQIVEVETLISSSASLPKG